MPSIALLPRQPSALARRRCESPGGDERCLVALPERQPTQPLLPVRQPFTSDAYQRTPERPLPGQEIVAGHPGAGRIHCARADGDTAYVRRVIYCNAAGEPQHTRLGGRMGAHYSWVMNACTLDMLITMPLPSPMEGIACFSEHRKALFRLTFITGSHSSSVVSVTVE